MQLRCLIPVLLEALSVAFVTMSLFLSTCVVVWRTGESGSKGRMWFSVGGGQLEVDKGDSVGLIE
jgi:hypothetical protein